MHCEERAPGSANHASVNTPTEPEPGCQHAPLRGLLPERQGRLAWRSGNVTDACSGGTSSPSGPGEQPGAMFWGGDPTQSCPSVGDQETQETSSSPIPVSKSGKARCPLLGKGARHDVIENGRKSKASRRGRLWMEENRVSTRLQHGKMKGLPPQGT